MALSPLERLELLRYAGTSHRRVPAEIKRFGDLRGRTLVSISHDDERVVFETDRGERCELLHEQDCCESVWLEDVTGNVELLLNAPLRLAEVVSQDNPEASESGTWTFYKLATTRGYVTFRFCGESNGYYSESVDFYVNGKMIWN